VARYQTPSGADINKVGIAPDAPLPRVGGGGGGAAGDGGQGAAAEAQSGAAAAAATTTDLPVTPDAFCAVLAADAGVASKLFS
jgi:C-terminal processing protease CtpA/Prc